MSEGNDGPPKHHDIRGPNVVDLQRRREEVLTKRAEDKFSAETEDFLTTVRRHLARIDKINDPETIQKEITILASAISIKSGHFIEERRSIPEQYSGGEERRVRKLQLSYTTK